MMALGRRSSFGQTDAKTRYLAYQGLNVKTPQGLCEVERIFSCILPNENIPR